MTRLPLSMDTIKARVLAEFDEVERIVLFGSRAHGDHREDSHVDLLVVAESTLPAAERSARLRIALRGLGVGFDLIVLTPEELERHRAWKSGVVAQALAEGIVLHAAA